MGMFSRVADQDRLIVVTGAGSGIGRATAERFARRGDRVIVTDVNVDAAKETAQLIADAGGIAVTERLDVSDNEDWERVARLAQDHGGADVLVNNAGMLVLGRFLEHSATDWDRTIAINLGGVVTGSRVFARQMVDNKRGGQIVNVASSGAWLPTVGGSAYSTTKAAVVMLSESMRIDLRDQGIGVSVICPGIIKTNLGKNTKPAENYARGKTEAFSKAGELQGGFSLFGSPDSVAAAIESAVRFDRAIVPVRPEAFVIYGVHRAAPWLVRGVAARVSNLDAGEELFARVKRLLPGSRS